MSKQKDSELLYLLAVENYKYRHNLNDEEINQLFNQNQIYENILIQYESLHQLDIVDTVDFIEEIIASNVNTLKVYHGTNCKFEKIDLTKSKNYRDFGTGYYCTILETQAISWAEQMHKRRNVGGVYVYEYDLLLRDDLAIKRFTQVDKDWLEFVKSNRGNGGLNHNYDIVIGPVADDNTFETIQLFTAGILTLNEAIKRLRYNALNNQISFHTDKAIRALKFIVRREISE